MLMVKTVVKRVRTAFPSNEKYPVLDTGEGGHSVFHSRLLEVLRENQAILEMERLFLAIRTGVMQTAGPCPLE